MFTNGIIRIWLNYTASNKHILNFTDQMAHVVKKRCTLCLPDFYVANRLNVVIASRLRPTREYDFLRRLYKQ